MAAVDAAVVADAVVVAAAAVAEDSVRLDWNSL